MSEEREKNGLCFQFPGKNFHKATSYAPHTHAESGKTKLFWARDAAQPVL